MRILRILTVVLFAVSLGLNIWVTRQYNAAHNTEGPKLSCSEETLSISVHDGDEALLRGLSAEDAQDGNLTDRILLSSKSYFLEKGVFNAEYVVFDSHQNAATLTRRVVYTDYESPKFALSQPLVYIRGNSIRYLNYVTASDVLDGDITDRIKVKASNVSNYTAGTYPVLLEVTNDYGDSVQVELNVVVLEGRSLGPVIRLSKYLTYTPCGEKFDPYDLILSVEALDGTSVDRNTVKVLGSVDIGTPGCYQLIYTCTYEGQEGRTYLTVVVEEEAQ